MPHIYFKTIGMTIAALFLFLLRFNLLTDTVAKYTAFIPAVALDWCMLTLVFGVLINEKMGERWGIGHYVLMFLALILTTIIIGFLYVFLKIS
ncbi:Uncharacterised protein [uncultured archaeon]|nr:Uncharacterised protein [uncultured archaeon]